MIGPRNPFPRLLPILRLMTEGASRRTIMVPVLRVSLLTLASSAVAASAPLALRTTVDALAKDRFHAALLFALLFAGLEGGPRLLRSLQSADIGGLSFALRRHLKVRAYRHVLALPQKTYLGRKAGELLRTVEHGAEGAVSIQFQVITGIVPIVVQSAFIAIFLLAGAPFVVTPIFLVFAVIYAAVYRRGDSRLTESRRVAWAAETEATARATDAVTNHEAIALFGGRDFAGRRIDAGFEDMTRRWGAVARRRAKNEFTLGAIVTVAITATLLVAVFKARHGTMTPGTFVMVNVYLLQLIAPIERIFLATREIDNGLIQLEGLMKLLAEETEPENGAPHLPGEGPLDLRFEAVGFAYANGRTVLDDVSFHAAPGRMVALVGASGAGKSTIARLLFGLYAPSTGTIRFDGAKAEAFSLSARRAAMAIVPQDTVLFHDTIAENIRFARPEATEAEIKEAARIAGLALLLERLPDGLETVVGERGLRLSGGEKQRVAIARAVLKRPRLFVLDEATSALDSRTEQEILANLREAAAGVTTLVIAHRLSTIREADEIVVLQHGGVTERGTHKALLASGGAYAALWQAQHEAKSGSEAVFGV